jgi:hypothetical protein
MPGIAGRPSAMTVRSLGFLLCSLGLHLALFWQAPPGTGPFESGVVRAYSVAPVTVQLIPERKPEPAPQPAPVAKAESAAATKDTNNASKQSAPPAAPAYQPPGRLTRLPAPMPGTDLSVEPLPFAVKIEFTVLVDDHGAVADVTYPPQPGRLTRVFADRVVERLRAARFTPGEIDGKPVASALKMTVVTEPPQPSDAR